MPTKKSTTAKAAPKATTKSAPRRSSTLRPKLRSGAANSEGQATLVSKITKRSANAAAVAAAPASDLTKKYRSHKGDNGSTDIRIIGLTEKIASLTSHLGSHTKDHDSRRGLLIMVGKRRRLLNYLKRQDEPTYGKLVVDLGLRK